jgi:hypothetical protein
MDERSVANLRRAEGLPGHGGADDGEDARADDGADAEGGERPGTEGFPERVLGLLRLADELVNGFAGEELAGQGGSPVSASLGQWIGGWASDAGTALPQCTGFE